MLLTDSGRMNMVNCYWYVGRMQFGRLQFGCFKLVEHSLVDDCRQRIKYSLASAVLELLLVLPGDEGPAEGPVEGAG